MKPTRKVTHTVVLAASLLVGCDSTGDRNTTEPLSGVEERQPTKVNVVAEDFAFDAPATISGGAVEFSYSNRGKEPHFAGLARVAPGKSFEDVQAAMTAPPSAALPTVPPPFEDFAGIPTADPGAGGKMTLNLPAGTYVFFCLIPSPDGVSHAAKGMMKELRVSEGTAGSLPKSDVTLAARDFAFDRTPVARAGNIIVRLRNEGQQLHEINLVELSAGKTVDDVVAWYSQMSGPPPMRSIAGAAIGPWDDATATINLHAERTYAFICAIPDVEGDFSPHVTKGMFTRSFTVS